MVSSTERLLLCAKISETSPLMSCSTGHCREFSLGPKSRCVFTSASTCATSSTREFIADMVAGTKGLIVPGPGEAPVLSQLSNPGALALTNLVFKNRSPRV